MSEKKSKSLGSVCVEEKTGFISSMYYALSFKWNDLAQISIRTLHDTVHNKNAFVLLCCAVLWMLFVLVCVRSLVFILLFLHFACCIVNNISSGWDFFYHRPTNIDERYFVPYISLSKCFIFNFFALTFDFSGEKFISVWMMHCEWPLILITMGERNF